VAAVLEEIESRLGFDADASLSTEVKWKAVSVGAGVLSAVLARKALATIWRGPDDDESRGFIAAAQWALASGIAIGVARTVGQRAAEKAWEQATGSPPPGQSS
jgi:Protein of unknown function (DUF4235)